MATSVTIYKWDDRAHELAMGCLSKQTGASWMNLTQYCISMQFFERMSVPSGQCACAPINRDGYGCNGYDVHENICDLVNSGWSDAYFDGILTDIDPAERQEVMVWNERMVAQSSNMLAPIVREDIKFMTLAGSHTTLGFRYIHMKRCFVQNNQTKTFVRFSNNQKTQETIQKRKTVKTMYLNIKTSINR